MDKGKSVCNVLKDVRKAVADANGIKYEGDFRNGKKHGQGTEYDKDGKEIRSGEFLMGNFRGK